MITGIGGVFFKARDPHALSTWYREHIGIPLGEEGYTTFRRAEDGPNGSTTIAIFPADTSYFLSGDAPFMLNLRVDDLDAVLDRLRSLGDPVDESVMEEANGRFGWVVNPEGHRIELWEPASEHQRECVAIASKRVQRISHQLALTEMMTGEILCCEPG